MNRNIASLALLAASSLSHANFITEIFANPPGTDQDQEAIELQSTPGFSWGGYYLLVVEGDGAAAGTVDQAVDLSTYMSGTNGLLLIRDSGTVVLSPAPDPATNVVVFNWTPDVENGSQTFVLGFGTPPALNADLDTNDDGILEDTLSGFTVVDAVGIKEDDGTAADDLSYAATWGGADFGITPDLDGGGYTGDVLYRILNSAGTAPNGWANFDVLGGAPGPYVPDPTEFTYLGSASPAPTVADVPMINPGTLNITWGGSSPTLSGTVTLADFTGSVASQTVMIEVYSADGMTLLETFNNVALDAGGAYSVNTTLAAGTYDVFIKGSHWLRKLSDDASFAPNATVSLTLTNGDVDGDNEVGPGDFGALSSAFGSVDGDSNWNAMADLDGDGEVGPSDFGILSANFGTSGD